MIQSQPIWQISEAEEESLAQERQRLEAALRLAPPLTQDGQMRNRRPRGSPVTKYYIIQNSVVSGRCWNWTRSLTGNGYGRVMIDGRFIGISAYYRLLLRHEPCTFYREVMNMVKRRITAHQAKLYFCLIRLRNRMDLFPANPDDDSVPF